MIEIVDVRDIDEPRVSIKVSQFEELIRNEAKIDFLKERSKKNKEFREIVDQIFGG